MKRQASAAASTPSRLVGGIACALRVIRSRALAGRRARAPLQIELGPAGDRVALCPRAPSALACRGRVLRPCGSSTRTQDAGGPRARALHGLPSHMEEGAQQAHRAWSRGDASAASRPGRRRARLLALESFVAASRSGDLEDAKGTARFRPRPSTRGSVVRLTFPRGRSWQLSPQEARSPISPNSDVAVEAPVTEAATLGGRHPVTAALEATLAQLRVASVETIGPRARTATTWDLSSRGRRGAGIDAEVAMVRQLDCLRWRSVVTATVSVHRSSERTALPAHLRPRAKEQRGGSVSDRLVVSWRHLPSPRRSLREDGRLTASFVCGPFRSARRPTRLEAELRRWLLELLIDQPR